MHTRYHSRSYAMGVREGKAVRHAQPATQPLRCHGYEGGQGSEAHTASNLTASMPPQVTIAGPWQHTVWHERVNTVEWVTRSKTSAGTLFSAPDRDQSSWPSGKSVKSQLVTAGLGLCKEVHSNHTNCSSSMQCKSLKQDSEAATQLGNPWLSLSQGAKTSKGV